MLAYYRERKRHSQLIYGSMILAKVGHLTQTISTITFRKHMRDWPPLNENYPDTPEDDDRFYNDTLIVTAQHMLCISFLIVAISLLQRNLKWARRINPIILTLAFVFDLPVIHVYTTYYFVLNVSVNMAMSFLIPWIVCETFAAQIIN